MLKSYVGVYCYIFVYNGCALSCVINIRKNSFAIL